MSTTTRAPVSRPVPDRFLLGILIGIAVVLVAAVISIAVIRQPVSQLPADTPDGTVQRFLLNLEKSDYAAAYALLSDSISDKPTLDEFSRYNSNQRSYLYGPERVTLLDTWVSGDTTYVNVKITRYYYNSIPPETGEYSQLQNIGLRQENNAWRITQLPYEYLPPGYPYKGY